MNERQGHSITRRACIGLAGTICLSGAATLFAPARSRAAEGEAVITFVKDGKGESPAFDASAASDGSASGDGAPRILVACFSATGNTARVAATIAEALEADSFEIAPAQPYTADDLDYNDSASRTSLERADEARANSVELAQTTPEGWDDYDVVFLGSPIWWGEPSWAVHGFVTGNDFAGKTVFYFCTSASSSLGGWDEFVALAGGQGDWREGVRFSSGIADEEVVAWLDGLELA